MQRLKTAVTRTLPLVVAAIVVAVALASTVPGERVLVVEDIETGEHYITQSVEDGATVGLTYTHSVEKSRVYDGYTVDDETLVMTRMEFESYGWGLPARVNVTNVDGTLVYDPPGSITELDTLSVSPGRIAGHSLVVENRTYDLVAATDERDVSIHIERRSPLHLLP